MTAAVNPFLPSWEYVPDGEPHVFGDRVYLYGSHDRFGGRRYCENDYVVWSAPLNDLSDWRLDSRSYLRTQDPDNRDGRLRLYAPDVAQGPDGRFYLYYCLTDHPKVSVAVADGPAGPFDFLGHVHDASGATLGGRPGDTQPFDPAVLVDEGHVWLYVGSGPINRRMDKKRRTASIVVELEPDMVTLRSDPRLLIPTLHNSAGTGFEGREFFEASSIRRFGSWYYFFYSSVLSHELCWARSERPDRGFEFGGRLISNADLLPEEDAPGPVGARTAKYGRNYLGNNHGSVERIGDRYVVFHHRHTNRGPASRQACAEPVVLDADGRFQQAELTSSGLSTGLLPGRGRYEARTACHLASGKGVTFSTRIMQNRRHPAFTQSPPDREERPDQYIANLRDGASALFRYFDLTATRAVAANVRGSGRGTLVVRDGAGSVAARLPVEPSRDWDQTRAPIDIADGVHSLSFTFEGRGAVDFLDFRLT